MQTGMRAVINEDQMNEPIVEHVIDLPDWGTYLDQYAPLHKYALKGDWNSAERLLRDHQGLANTRITLGGETALHIAAAEGHTRFVERLLEKMQVNDLSIQNGKQCTALCFAAAAGHVDIAKLLVDKNPDLPTSRCETSAKSLYMAIWEGHSEMAKYLLDKSGIEDLTENDQINLLTRSIQSGLYDIAKRILEQCQTSAMAQGEDGETPLEVLARRPLTFSCTSQRGFWGNIASTMLSYMKLNARNSDEHKLFECLWESVRSRNVETTQLLQYVSTLLFLAAESGNENFLLNLIRRCPDAIYKFNDSERSIFHIAVLHRYEKVFNLIYEQQGVKYLILSFIDKNQNSILHLAAKLAPPYQLDSIPGAAFQMQREVLWYKEIEMDVHPSYRNMKNSDGQTPYELFLAQHKDLMKAGEKQMKQIAKSCMLVTILIATVVFTIAFTVPGGYNNNGALILQNEKLFLVFPLSEAVATLASLTSMLMFLSMLISPYTDIDFLWTLPFCLVVGVTSLFVSVVAMMVALCNCLLLYKQGHTVMISLLVLFLSVPIIFVIFKYPLLATIVRCTYSSKWLFRPNNRLFS